MKTRNAHCGLTAATPSSSPTRSGVAGSTSARAGAHRRPAFLRRALALLLSLTLGLSASRGLGAPLTPLVGSPYNSGGNSQVATLSRDGNFLFVTNQSTGIKVMTVAANGVPTLFGTFTTTPASGTTGVVTSPDGKYLYATTLGNTVNVHSVAANGTLAQIQAATLGTASAAENGITYVRTSGGDFVYVNNNAAPNTVTGFPVQANGTLGSPTSTATGGNAGAGYFASPRMMCKCLATQRIFVLNSSSNTVSVFNVAANGALTLVGSPFAIGGTSSGAIAVDSPATHLYAALSNGSVTKFNIDATTGALTSAGTFATGVGNPDGLTVSPGGTYLLAADPGSGGRIAVLTAANMLPVAGSPIVSSVATSVEFNKAGTIIYVGNTSGVAAYTFFAPDPSGPSNTAPVANAGTNQSVNELDPVTLHGTASDPDNNPLTYAWTQLLPGAYPVTLTGANTLTPTFTAPALNLGGAPGGTTLTFQLIVNDGTVNSAPSTVSVNVTNVNHAPLADAGPDQTVPEGAPVGLNGANSADTDGDTLTYDWIQIDGPSVVLSATNVASPGFTAPDVGPAGAALEFMLTVNDGYGGVKSDNVVVNVTYTNRPPVADAGAAQTVNEGDTATLAGTASDPDGNPLSITWSQVSGPAVTLANNGGLTPSFTAPLVDRFAADVVLRLSVDDGFGGTASSDVSIHIANINHAPVADAGLLQSVPEGTPVGLAGSGLDQDTEEQPLLTYAWVQTFGPAVILTGANTTTPSFTAPLVTAGGDPNAKVKLKFQLTVTDPNNASASADTCVSVANVDHAPIANAGGAVIADEASVVMLDGSFSSDPDGDTLTYVWVQTAGPAVTLANASTAAPSFTAPFVNAAGATLKFSLTVSDGFGGVSSDTATVSVRNINDPPTLVNARASLACLWPPNHQLVPISILGVVDPNNNATIRITGVTQDEATNGLGDGDTAIDAIINADGTVLLRAERSGKGNGRVYHIHFTASDLEGSVSGVVTVCVPHSKKTDIAIDGGELFDSTR